MTSTPARRTLIRTAAWATPVIALASTAPVFAASNPELFSINFVPRPTGGVQFNITNLTTNSIAVRLVFAVSQSESDATGFDEGGDWGTTREDGNFVATTTIGPHGSTSGVNISWELKADDGEFTFTVSSGAQTITTTLPYSNAL